MAQILLVLGTVVLILLSLFIVLLVLLQRGAANAGLGTAFGGDAMSSAFGTETGNFLSKATIWGCVGFFVLTFSLYLGHMARTGDRPRGGVLPGAELLVEPDAPGATTPEGVVLPEGVSVLTPEEAAAMGLTVDEVPSAPQPEPSEPAPVTLP